jgi:N-acetylglucosamine-6-phosphate deacetylase
MRILKGNIITPYEIIKNGMIVIDNGIIEDIFRDGSTPVSGDITDIGNGYILPGLIDIHNHGGAGYDYMDATEEAFNAISVYLASHGVTTSLATTVTAPLKSILNCLKNFREMSGSVTGCRLLGIHLEGPYLSVRNKGAQPEDYLLTPEKDGYGFVLEYADIIKLITVSPELPGMRRMIRDLKRAGIVISGGHDDAVELEIFPAIDAGMTHTTHIYCAMSTLQKRNTSRYCGLCEIAMSDDRLTTEMIADNHHIPATFAKIIYKLKGADKVCIVSDCLRAGGLENQGGIFYLGQAGEKGHPIIIEDGIAMLPDKSRFAGSVQALDRMIKNCVQDSGIPLPDAVRMASLTPASVIGIHKETGSIAIGKRADICIMDNDFNVTETILEGRTIYQRR